MHTVFTMPGRVARSPACGMMLPTLPTSPAQFQATAEQMMNPHHVPDTMLNTEDTLAGLDRHILSAAARVWLTVNGYHLGEEGISHGLHRKKSAWKKLNVLSLLKVIEARS